MTHTTTFVGLDVHASGIALALLPPGAERPIEREIPNDPKVIRRTFTRLKAFSPLRCCYEAGPCGFELHRQLTALGIPCEVVAPALTPRKPGERIKTDRRDARKLVRLYRAGELTPIRVPTPEQEAVRDLVRAREDVRRDLTAARHRLSKFLLRHGRLFTQGQKWTQRFWRWLRIQRVDHPAARVTFEPDVRPASVERGSSRRLTGMRPCLAIRESQSDSSSQRARSAAARTVTCAPAPGRTGTPLYARSVTLDRPFHLKGPPYVRAYLDRSRSPRRA